MVQIHKKGTVGDILVFVPGKREIKQVIRYICNFLREEYEKVSANDKCSTKLVRRDNHSTIHQPTELVIMPLHAQLSQTQKQRAIDGNPHNSQRVRKCVVATNIAETSLTIHGVVFVVDTGLSRQTGYDVIETLSIQPISKNNVLQRQGRAGRTTNGQVYHLYTQQSFTKIFPNETTPEICKKPLETEILLLKMFDFCDVSDFDFIDTPNPMNINRALDRLLNLGCIDENGSITQLGKEIAQLPMKPQLAKAIHKSVELNCTDGMLTVAAMMEIWRRIKLSSKKHFVHESGDHCTLLNIANAYRALNSLENVVINSYDANCWQMIQESTENFEMNDLRYYENSSREIEEAFCDEHQLTRNDLQNVFKYKAEYESIIRSVWLSNNVAEEKYFASDDYFENILKCLVSGFFENVAFKNENENYVAIKIGKLDDNNSFIHRIIQKDAVFSKQSIYNEFEEAPTCVLYHNVVEMSGIPELQCVSFIDPKWLIEMAPEYFNLTKLEKDQTGITKFLK